MQATGNEQAASGMAGHHDHHGMDHHGKLLMDPNIPASFDEAPAMGTKFTCPVSGGVFEVEPHTRMSLYEGRHYAFCCGGCAQDFDADPAYFANRLEESLSDQ
jgi:YHS domain-containing protein